MSPMRWAVVCSLLGPGAWLVDLQQLRYLVDHAVDYKFVALHAEELVHFFVGEMPRPVELVVIGGWRPADAIA